MEELSKAFLEKGEKPHYRLETRRRSNNIFTLSQERAVRHAYIVFGWDCSRIAQALNVAYIDVYKLARRRKWPELQKRIDTRIIASAIAANERDFKEIIGLNTEIIRRFAKQTLKDVSGNKITFKDAKLASDMVANFWRMYQVTQNKPDSIKQIEHIQNKNVHEMLREIAQDLKDDPMIDWDAFINESKIQ